MGKLLPFYLQANYDDYLDRCTSCFNVSSYDGSEFGVLLTVFSGNCFYVMLHAIFPSIAHVHNPFSSQVTMTGGRLIGFAVGWV
jgi:hypothetical protein